MNWIISLVVLFALLSSCKQRDLSLEDLQEAKWDSLIAGIEYIDKKTGNNIRASNDSIEIKFRGVSENHSDLVEIALKKIPSKLDSILSEVLNEYLPESKAGYLKINLEDWLRPAFLTGRIYLRGDYAPPFNFISDSIALRKISGIKEVAFISKEMATEMYINQGNEDWRNILNDNPLPGCIEIKLEPVDWTEESLSKLKNAILDQIGVMVSDVSFPSGIYEKTDKYFFFEYERK